MSLHERQNHKTGAALDDAPPGIPTGASNGFLVKNKLLLCAVAVVLLAAGIWFFTRPKEQAKPATEEAPAVLTVTTQPVQEKVIDRHISVNGSVSAWDPLQIGAEVSQLRVDTVQVEEGAIVKKGQVLATLNSSVLKAQLDQLKAHLAADEASLRKAIQPNRVEDLNSWRAALKQAEANLAQEEANLGRARANAANVAENARRYGELRKVGAVSQMDADTKSTDAKTSAADVSAAEKRVEAMRYALRQAKEKLSMAEQGGRKEDILISRASLEETKAKIAQLAAQIEQTVIRAPDDGKIVKRDVHLGEISSVGKNMFTMVRNTRFELRAQVPEVDIPRIKPGMAVEMTATGDGATPVMGTVREVSPFVDEKTRMGMARIDLPSSTAWMKPGLFFHADIDLGKDKAIVVPSKAVLSRNEKDVIFIENGGHASMRPVVIGEPLADGELEIRSGVQPGELAIVSGAGFMKDGDKVRSVPEKSEARR